jgi:hypothetical protein
MAAGNNLTDTDDSVPHVLDDREIVTKVLAKAKESVGWYDSRLSIERMRVLQYYNGELPKRQHVGASSFISPEVYDGVEMMKAQLLEVFAGGENIARFDPDQTMDAEACRVATEYARFIIFQQNPGFDIFETIIHDALMARIGVAKVYWDERTVHRDEEFDGLQPHEAMGLAAQDDVDEFDGTLDEDTGTYAGTLTRRIDKAQVCIDVLPPEEFLISPRWPILKTAPYCGHRTLKTKAELIEEGYDEDIVMDLHYDDSKGLDLSPEVIERNKPIETAQALDNPVQPEMELVMLYESYIRMMIDPKKGVRLYKIVHVNEVILDKQEVDKAPFLVYIPLPIPHLFYGNNYAARIIPYQNAQSILNRAVLDHTSITVNPRWQVVKGGLINPREMLENRLGGIVNVRTPESVAPLAYPNLNPFVFQVMQQMQENKETTTGISSLSQGLNKDAISQQNSQGLVDNLVNLSTTRQKIAARNFAYGFYTDLMLEVIRLAILHEKKEKFIQVAGDVLKITPQQWTERTTCSVSLHLGYGEKDQQVQQMTAAYAGMAQDPGLAPGFGYPQRYNMVQAIMKKRGWADGPNWLAPPNQVKPPQPDPLKVQEVQAKTQTAAAALMNAKANMQHEGTRGMVDSAKVKLDAQRNVMQSMDHDREQKRKDVDVANKVNIAQRKMDLEERGQQHQHFDDAVNTASKVNVDQRRMALDEHQPIQVPATHPILRTARQATDGNFYVRHPATGQYHMVVPNA